MTLRVHRSSGGSIKISLTECPACGADLSGGKKASYHIRTEHGPEDFGLEPLDPKVAADGGVPGDE